AEHGGEVDRRGARRIGLTGRLVDRHRWGRGVKAHAVIGRGGGGVDVSRRIIWYAGFGVGDHRAAGGHAGDCHGVGAGAAAHRLRLGAAATTADHTLALHDALPIFAEHGGEVDRRGARRIGLTGGLVDRHRWGRGVKAHAV